MSAPMTRLDRLTQALQETLREPEMYDHPKDPLLVRMDRDLYHRWAVQEQEHVQKIFDALGADVEVRFV